MRKAGALTALIAGILGLVAGIGILFLGGMVGTPEPDRAQEVIYWLGWGGIAVSLIVIVLGAISFKTRSRLSAILLMVAAAIGAVFGSGPISIFMSVAFVGGIVALFGDKQRPLPEA